MFNLPPKTQKEKETSAKLKKVFEDFNIRASRNNSEKKKKT